MRRAAALLIVVLFGCSSSEPNPNPDPVAAPALASFTAAPAVVVAGVPTEVTWTWSYANAPSPELTCSIDGGVGPVANGATTSVTITGTTTFSLTCANSQGSDTATVEVVATPTPTAPELSSFTATPAVLVEGVPTSVTFAFGYANTPAPEPTCTVDQGVGAVTSGAVRTLTLTTATVYTLTCANGAGSDTAQVTVDVLPTSVAPVLQSFMASPATVYEGVATDVTWSWSFANSPTPAPTCSIAPGVGTLTSGVASTVTLATETVFTLTCSNAAGSDQAQLSIATAPLPVAPIISTFTVSPYVVTAGVPTDVTWAWAFANSPSPAPTCVIDQGIGDVESGAVTTVNLPGGSKNYVLTCSNAGGSDTEWITIYAKAPPVIATFEATPSSVTSGAQTGVTFSWSYAGTAYPEPTCAVEPGFGAISNGALRYVTLTADTAYTLTCQNSEGSDTRQVTVVVTPPVAPQIATFTVSEPYVRSGTNTWLVWSWTYADSPVPQPSCRIDPGVGMIGNGSAAYANITADTIYTLTCTNGGGSSTAQLTLGVAVPPVLGPFTASPSVLAVGAPTAVTWSWSLSNVPIPDATCSIDGGVGAIAPGTSTTVTLSRARTYRLSCANVGGTVVSDVTLGVDECAAGVDDCGANAHCVDTLEGYTCACDAGFAGDGNACSALAGCDSVVGVCAADASCVDTGAGWACVCPPGYSGDGLTCERQRLAFVTSLTGLGDLSQWADAGGHTGLAAGDAVCQARAASAGLPGSWVAWLSDSHDDAYCRVHGSSGKRSAKCGQAVLPAAAGPWIRTDLLPFAPSIASLLAPGRVVFHPAATDEYGVEVALETDVFTGTSVTGELRFWPSSAPTPCLDWTSSASANHSVNGQVFGGGILWTDEDLFGNNCSDAARIRCLEIGAGPPLPTRHTTARKLFVTSVKGSGDLSSWIDAGPASGVAAADAICRARARAGGLANAELFKALISDSSPNTAASRIISNGPWVRPDGVLVADDEADLLDGTLHAPISVDELGAYLDVNDLAWTGTTVGGGAASNRCSSWSTGSVSVLGSSGSTDLSDRWLGVWSSSCNSLKRLVCLED